MKRDLVLKCSIAVKLIKSENYEKFCITAFSFSDPQMHYRKHRHLLFLSRGIDMASVISFVQDNFQGVHT